MPLPSSSSQFRVQYVPLVFLIALPLVVLLIPAVVLVLVDLPLLVPKIVLDNSPLANRIHVLDVTPELEPYDIGLFTLKKNLANPLVEAFWNLM